MASALMSRFNPTRLERIASMLNALGPHRRVIPMKANERRAAVLIPLCNVDGMYFYTFLSCC